MGCSSRCRWACRWACRSRRGRGDGGVRHGASGPGDGGQHRPNCPQSAAGWLVRPPRRARWCRPTRSPVGRPSRVARRAVGARGRTLWRHGRVRRRATGALAELPDTEVAVLLRKCRTRTSRRSGAATVWWPPRSCCRAGNRPSGVRCSPMSVPISSPDTAGCRRPSGRARSAGQRSCPSPHRWPRSPASRRRARCRAAWRPCWARRPQWPTAVAVRLGGAGRRGARPCR